MLRVLVLAPHPDDFDEVGITLRMLRDNGNPIDLVVLTGAASGVEDCFRPGLTRAEKAALREEEQRASLRFFGLPENQATFLRLDEDAQGHLQPSEVNLSRLRVWWDAHPADLVFLPHGNDTNASHQRTYAFFRELRASTPRPLLALLQRDPKTVAMREDVITVFGAAEAEWKAELLRFHQTQQQRNLRTRGYGLDERILRMNRAVATRFGRAGEYAEAFELEVFRRDCDP
jgi:LmbE family N-acetylglucosaminyl deacetylase